MDLGELREERRALIERLVAVQEAIRSMDGTVEPVLLHPPHGGARPEVCHLPASGQWVARYVQGSITQIIGIYASASEAMDAADRWTGECGV